MWDISLVGLLFAHNDNLPLKFGKNYLNWSGTIPPSWKQAEFENRFFKALGEMMFHKS